MAEVRWSVDAREHVRAIAREIAKTSAHYAAATGERIYDAAALLADFPRLGRMVPEYEDEAVRELIVASYRVIYLVDGDLVAIAAVIHGGRDLLAALGPQPWDLR